MGVTRISKIVPAVKGEWNASTTYDYLDVVQKDGSSWLARVSNTNVEPVSGDTWMLLAIRGDQGLKGDGSYLHVAYANSADGITDFATSPVKGVVYTYIGSYCDYTKSASSSPSTYTWALLSNEAERAAAEMARTKAEESRASAEKSRQSAESARVDAEQERVTAETNRTSAETARATAETERRTAESNRESAEKERAKAESGRESAFDSAIANAESATADAKTAAEAIAFMSFELDSDGYLCLDNPYSSFYFEVNDGYLEVVS